MPLWKEYDLSRDWCVEYIENIFFGMRTSASPADRTTTIASRLCGLTDRTVIAVFSHLGFSDPRVDLSAWRDLAAEAPDLAVLYFYGEWRRGFVEWEMGPVDHTKPWIKSGPLTVEECRNQLKWLDHLRYGLLWSSFFDAGAQLQQLAHWADTDLRFDEGLCDRTEEDCWFYVLLCKVLRGEERELDGELAGRIRAGKRKRPKLLLAALRSIVSDDNATFAKGMSAWLQHVGRSEFRTVAPIDDAISLDGTVLWHLARRRGLNLPELPPTQMALILRDQATA